MKDATKAIECNNKNTPLPPNSNTIKRESITQTLSQLLSGTISKPHWFVGGELDEVE